MYHSMSEEIVVMNNKICDWLSFCLKKLDEGKQNEIPRDPFYHSIRGQITPTYIDAVVKSIDDYLDVELKMYANYHMGQQGTTTPPEFRRLNDYGKRAMVEGLDRILSGK